MQTSFTEAQLAEPAIMEANAILRNCVHCGFCLSACPTYALLGDERDSPRGRIYMIKDMLQAGGRPADEIVHHVDRCMSCLACMNACPSGVHYQHYVDNARVHIEKNYVRPWFERLLRRAVSMILPHPGRARLALRWSGLARPFAGMLGNKVRAMLDLAPARLPPRPDDRMGRTYPAEGARRMRVLLLPGCVQDVLRPNINDATIRLLNRLGCEVAVARDTGCCGALTHHLGDEKAARRSLEINLAAWRPEIEAGEVDAIVTNAAGCGTVVKDYGHMADTDEARRVSGLTRDISEILGELGLGELDPGGPGQSRLPAVAYQDACSLKNGQGIAAQPRALLTAAGFRVGELAETHCCGSAGSYNILQPEIADALAARKIDAIRRTRAEVVATGNIGCLHHLRQKGGLDVFHTVELLDWATGGPDPRQL